MNFVINNGRNAKARPFRIWAGRDYVFSEANSLKAASLRMIV